MDNDPIAQIFIDFTEKLIQESKGLELAREILIEEESATQNEALLVLDFELLIYEKVLKRIREGNTFEEIVGHIRYARRLLKFHAKKTPPQGIHATRHHAQYNLYTKMKAYLDGRLSDYADTL